MPQILEKLEKLQLSIILNDKTLIENLFSSEDGSLCLVAHQLATGLLNGDYKKGLLETEEYSQLFFKLTKSKEGFDKDSYDELEENINSFLQKYSKTENEKVAEMIVLLFGCLCLSIFIQNNWTGPTIKVPLTPFVNFMETKKLDEFQVNKYAIKTLSIGGEVAYEKTRCPHYLLCALSFLTRKDISLNTYNWWKGRCYYSHQRILSHYVEVLLNSTNEVYKDIIEKYGKSEMMDGELAARAYLERGIVNSYYKHSLDAKHDFHAAKAATGLITDLKGVMGKRTKFQTFKTAQLTLSATSKEIGKPKEEEKEEEKVMPSSVQLDEDNPLLEKPDLDEEEEQKNLRVIDQAIILALCIDVKNNNPVHGLTTEEMFPFIHRVGLHANNWMVHTTHLLFKSRLEVEKTKTVERAILQLEVLVKQFEDQDPGVVERMRYFYCLAFPPLFKLQKELGERFMNYGAIRSALQIYEQLDMWDEIIQCYMILDKENTAESIINERLKIDPDNPTLYCLLGNLKDDPKYYLKAWEVSNCRFARAKRELGRYYVKKQNNKEAIKHFEDALSLNALYPMTWFAYGCACLFEEEYEKAVRAFTRVVQLEPTDSEAWSNLATVLLKLGKKKEAFEALQQALKEKYDNWRMWENFQYISLEVGEWQHTIHAIERIVEINKERLDLEVIKMLMKVMVNEIQQGRQIGHILQTRLSRLFTKLVEIISDNAALWGTYAEFYEQTNASLDKIIELRQKQLRYLQKGRWFNDATQFENVAQVALKLTDTQIKLSENVEEKKQILSSAVMLVRSILKRTEDSFGSTELYKKLSNQLETLEKLRSL